MANKRVDVVLATYNGEKYIKEQVVSILNQTYEDIRIFVRDDGSDDDTLAILHQLSQSDSRLVIIEDHHNSGSVGENFKRLLSYCSADYVFLSDQDDVWLRHKIEKLMEVAVQHDDGVPLIAYSSGNVVNSSLHPIGKLTGYKLKVKSIEDLYLMNGGVQGCAMVINKALYKKVLEDDFFWYMHDQVITLYAACFGRIVFLNEPLFLYRQHNNNVLGFNASGTKEKIKRYLSSGKSSFLINKHSYNLFKVFLACRASELPSATRKSLSSYIKSLTKNKFLLLFYIIFNRITLRGSLIRAVIKLAIVRNILQK